jgi:fatty acid desaturase
MERTVNPSCDQLTDLEVYSKAEILDDAGTSYVQFRSHLKPNYFRVWLGLAAGFLVLALTCICLMYISQGWSELVAVAVASPVIGLEIAYIHLFFHEATHFNLLPSRTWNDRVANVVMGPLLLTEIRFYRALHMAHHASLGGHGDTEISYRKPLTAGFILSCLSGMRVFEVILFRKLKSSSRANQRQSNVALWGALLHASIFLTALYFGHTALAFSWILGVVCFVPFFGALRQQLEHRRLGSGSETYETKVHGRFTRTFAVGVFGRLFGAAGFNRHLIHHWDPTLSYTCFEAVEAFLMRTRLASSYQNSRKSYWHVFVELWRDGKQSYEIKTRLSRVQ